MMRNRWCGIEPRLPRARGFSLIEMMLALTLGAVIVTVTTSVLVQNVKNDKRGRARSAMARDGAFAAAALANGLRTAGLGIPDGSHLVSGMAHNYVVIAGTANAIGVVGDLPRPHRTFPTFGILHGRAPSTDCGTLAEDNNARFLAWHTENNGGCMPGTGVFDCNPEETSLFFPLDSPGLCEGSWQDRICPWGLGRLSPNENFQVVAGGLWTNAVFPAVPIVTDEGGTYFLDLGSGNEMVDTPSRTWKNCTGDAPHEMSGSGFVTTLDRIFFRICETANVPGCATAPVAPPYELQRKQCWGPIDTTDGNWPSGGNAIGALSTSNGPTSCEPSGEGWEVLLTDIETYSFRFFDGGTATTAPVVLALPLSEANKALVRRFEFDLRLEKLVDGYPMQHGLSGGVAIRNPL